ncbi:MAG: FkbM family methyltransferase [Rhodospirillales bacterium]|nr:FkbM family methyltransferase [Rhodospirillales bacterium]
MASGPDTLSEWGKFFRDLFRARALRRRWRLRIPLASRLKRWRRNIDRRARDGWRGGYIRLEEGGHLYIPEKVDVMAGLSLVHPHRPDSLIGSFCRLGNVAIDVGANLGEWALPMAKAVGPTGRVFAFEPVPHLAEGLDKTFRINGLAHARTVKKALGDKNGETAFIFDEDHTGMSSFIGSLAEGTTTRELSVETVTLDSFVRNEGLERLDFVKIDVQGCEAAVLEGATDTLGQLCPALIIEAGVETPGERVKISEILKAAGYDMAGINLEHGILETGWEEYCALSGPFAGTYCDVVFLPPRRA